jgi:hypothetical protein
LSDATSKAGASKVIDLFDKCSQKPPTLEEENQQQAHGNQNKQKSAAVRHPPSSYPFLDLPLVPFHIGRFGEGCGEEIKAVFR